MKRKAKKVLFACVLVGGLSILTVLTLFYVGVDLVFNRSNSKEKHNVRNRNIP